MFIKHGDGKIVSVLDEEELTDEQKKALKDLSKEVVKTSKEKSQDKMAGR